MDARGERVFHSYTSHTAMRTEHKWAVVVALIAIAALVYILNIYSGSNQQPSELPFENRPATTGTTPAGPRTSGTPAPAGGTRESGRSVFRHEPRRPAPRPADGCAVVGFAFGRPAAAAREHGRDAGNGLAGDGSDAGVQCAGDFESARGDDAANEDGGQRVAVCAAERRDERVAAFARPAGGWRS
jgi:hypothetical protein